MTQKPAPRPLAKPRQAPSNSPATAGRKGALGQWNANDTGRADAKLRRFSWDVE